MGLLTILLVYGLRRRQMAQFFRRIGYMLILSNISYAFTQMGTLWEQTNHGPFVNYLIAIMMGVSVFLWYGAACLVHWLFAFRYWIIAEEAPALLT